MDFQLRGGQFFIVSVGRPIAIVPDGLSERNGKECRRERSLEIKRERTVLALISCLGILGESVLPVLVRSMAILFRIGDTMAVTTLRPMPHTEIDDSFKSELLGALCFFCLAPIGDYMFLPHFKKRLVTATATEATPARTMLGALVVMLKMVL